MANAAGTLGTFAGIGALAAVLSFIPNTIAHHLIDNSPFLAAHPNLKSLVTTIENTLSHIGAVTAAAAILGTPFGPTVICMLVLPVVFSALSALITVVSAALAYSCPDTTPDIATAGM